MRIIKEQIDSERAHGIALLVLLVLLCVASVRIYDLQKDVSHLLSTTQALDKENAVQGSAIHRIVERMNKK